MQRAAVMEWFKHNPAKVFLLILILMSASVATVFAYSEVLDLRGDVGQLTEQVNGLSAQLSDLTNTKNFSFKLPRYAGDVLTMELSFKIVGENLSINASLDHGLCCLIMVFDNDGDGKIAFNEEGWLLYYGNNYHTTYVNVTSGNFLVPRMIPFPSPYHHVTRTENTTSYYIMFPLDMLNLHNDLLYISEEQVDGRGVLFHFNLEV
jgi:hypothetical protein